MIARLSLVLIAAAALTIAPALLEGHYLNRWGAPADLVAAAKQVESFPRDFGAWKFQNEGEQLSPMVIRELALAGYATRTYVNRDNGSTVSVLAMVGQAGPLVRHPPNICYTNLANEQVGAATKLTVNSTQPPSEFSLLEFRRPQSATNDRFLVAYGMATGAQWKVPRMPRIEFGAAPLLYKVQFLTSLGPSQTIESGTETLQKFAEDFCAAFQQHLGSKGA